MLTFEDILADMAVSGLEPGEVVRILATNPAGPDALTVIYRRSDGSLREQMLLRSELAALSQAQSTRPWEFDAEAEDFKLAVEAFRIELAHLFDPMMAVHASNVEPLPHQITAVYESMLPRQPLRFVLADDPGAGKTIMAGLYIRELLIRADARRVLIVAPGSLVEQWQGEMSEKFGLTFTLFSREMVEQASANPFDDADLMVARIDQLARSDELQEKLRQSRWDLIVVDEAHKLSATYSGQDIKKTRRFALGEMLGSITRHFLLMTATPHNGKEADFQIFMSLLDPDRFYGPGRNGGHKADVSDLMRRMVKEDLLKFDSTRLFPERRAYSVRYTLSPAESALYDGVTSYVTDEFDRAERLGDGARKGAVGFALTSLQRRLASSPEAIFQSLRRRRSRLEQRIADERQGRNRNDSLTEVIERARREGAFDDMRESDESLSSKHYEDLEQAVVDQASAAQTIQELATEIEVLRDLESQARRVVHSGQDRKWEELSSLLQDTPDMRDEAGRQRKLIIFTEHRDTLNYLATRIRGLLGSPESVEMIHGSVKREDRRAVQERFRNDPDVRVLLATDAAGEGVNLQNANLMVNYDLPWNPNRLEQRFGRIHRIGQTEVCHLWNMIAAGTREGDVFQRLFDKLEVERKALGGRVFDILGEVFEDKSLHDLLIEAVRYGADPEVRARLQRKVEGALDTGHLRDIIERNALCEDVMDQSRIFAIKDEMDRAEARKLQPFFIRAFFMQAFGRLGGKLHARESGRFEITHVPAGIREHGRTLAGRTARNTDQILRRYERVCFEKRFIRLTDRAGSAMASLLHPGHPLMQSVTDLVRQQHGSALQKGAVLVNPTDMGIKPKVLILLDHRVKEGARTGSGIERDVSRRMQFVEIDPQGNAASAGWAPHLDLTPIAEADRELIADELDADWIGQDLEQVALAHAATHLVPEHFEEVRKRREQSVDKTLGAVRERLVREISYLSDRCLKLKDDEQAGKDVRLALDNFSARIEETRARLDAREKELKASRHVVSATPVILGAALVVPAGLLLQRKKLPGWSADAAARSRIEQIAMQAVMNAERALGHDVRDVSAEKCGWDVTSQPRPVDGRLPDSRHIEVKGRARGQSTITVSRNEILCGLNQADRFILAIVLVDDAGHEGPYYVREPFEKEPDWAVTSINLDLEQLLARACPAGAAA